MSLTATLVGIAILSVQCGIGIQVIREGIEAGKDIMDGSKKEQELYEKSCLIETPAKRLDLLKEALTTFGYTIKEDEKNCLAYLGEEKILFEKTEKGNYTALFIGEENQEAAKQKAESIYEHYTRLVQQKAYHTLLQRAKEKGYQLESESIGEDQSIKLSFVVGE